VHCSEYISEYLAAHADDELTPFQRHQAEDHVGECSPCQRRLGNEFALKELIHRHVNRARSPAELRLRIRATLHEASALGATNVAAKVGLRASSHVRDSTVMRRNGTWREAMRRIRRPQIWIPLGIAGSLVMVLALLTSRPGGPMPAIAGGSVPAFDAAISKYLEFQRGFIPDVPPEALTSGEGINHAREADRNPVQRVTASNDSGESWPYREVNMPDDLLDLSAAGYQIVDGRVDHLPNHRLVTYTLYGGRAGQILSLCFKDATMSAPVGAVDWLGLRSFYAYKGYSICLSFYPVGHFVSILVSRMPLRQLVSYVASADTATVAEK